MTVTFHLKLTNKLRMVILSYITDSLLLAMRRFNLITFEMHGATPTAVLHIAGHSFYLSKVIDLFR